MRLTSILHPELVLNRRGSRRKRDYYQDLLPRVQYEGFGNGFYTDELIKSLDINSADHLCLVRRWLLDNGSIYHVAKDFLTEISKVNRAIPINQLPDEWCGYISFAAETLRDDTHFVGGAYVYVGPAGKTSFGNPAINPLISDLNQKVLWVAYIGEDESEIVMATLRIPVEEKKLEEVLPNYTSWDFDAHGNTRGPVKGAIEQAREVIFRTLINLVLYINQPDPELVREMPVPPTLVERKRELLRTKAEQGKAIYNQCSLPVIFVNWAWRRPMVGHTVSGHLKWVPYGPGKTKKRIQWIDAYPRGKFETHTEQEQT